MRASITDLEQGQGLTVSDGPRDGDVVVAADLGSPGRFTVRQFPRKPQVSWPSRELALDSVRVFARLKGVDVWVADRRSRSLVERYRAGSLGGRTSVRQAEEGSRRDESAEDDECNALAAAR
jgi:hypothetical protein